MLEVEKKVDDRISLSSLGLGSIYVEGTIIEVKDAGELYVSYKVTWDDGQYNDEWWSGEELAEVDESDTQTHLRNSW